jgi:hypothetical protein
MPLDIGGSTYSENAFTPTSGTLTLPSTHLSMAGWVRKGRPESLVRAQGSVSDWRYPNSSGWNGAGAWQVLDSRMGWSAVDRGSNFSTSTGRFTAPSNGYYHFMMSHYMLNDISAPYNTGTGYIHPQFARNGSLGWNNGNTPYTIYTYGAAANYPDGINISGVMYLNSGDYVDQRIYINSNDTRIYPAHSAFWCWKIG